MLYASTGEELWPMFTLRLLIALAAVIFTAAEVHAQPASLPTEVGVGASVFVPRPDDWITDDLTERAADFRITKPLSRNFAVEALVTVGRRNERFSSLTEGLYLIQVRQRLARLDRRTLHWFLTYGAGGYYAFVKDQRRSAHSAYRTIDEPYNAFLGVAVQREIASHLAVRADAQIATVAYIPIGSRYSVGLSVPFGRYKGDD
jgi:hypothetical protein